MGVDQARHQNDIAEIEYLPAPFRPEGPPAADGRNAISRNDQRAVLDGRSPDGKDNPGAED